MIREEAKAYVPTKLICKQSQVKFMLNGGKY